MNIQLENTTVLHNGPQIGGCFLLVLSAPATAPLVMPGQFVHLRIPNRNDILLRRPFSVFKADRNTVSILYKTVGEGTRALNTLRVDQNIDLMGPLGHGFPQPDPSKASVLVAGGYGMAALYLTAEQASEPGYVFAGGARREDILCIHDFQSLGWEMHLATEDGSEGFHGRVTEALDHWFLDRPHPKEIEIFACGPMGMLRAVSRLAQQWNCTAWISLDHYMACGVGACLACVHKINRNGEEKLACTCKEGPVFESREIVWD